MNKKMKISIIVIFLIVSASFFIWKYINKIEDYYNIQPKEKYTYNEIFNQLSNSDSIKLKAIKDVLIEVCGQVSNIKMENNIPIVEMGVQGSMNSIIFQMDAKYVNEIETLQQGKEYCIKGILSAYTVDEELGLGTTIQLKYCVISQ